MQSATSRQQCCLHSRTRGSFASGSSPSVICKIWTDASGASLPLRSGSRIHHLISRAHTVEVTSVDIEPINCSCCPQLDDRPVTTEFGFSLEFSSQSLTSHNRNYGAGFPNHHKGRRWDRIALSGSVKAV